MGTRFIHKDGKVIPLHSDHGDQQAPGAEHASAATPPNAPAPVAGKEEHNHPAPVAAPVAPAPVASVASPVAVPKMKKGPC